MGRCTVIPKRRRIAPRSEPTHAVLADGSRLSPVHLHQVTLMQIKIKGEMSLPKIRAAPMEQLMLVEDRYGVRFSLDATLYIRPSNGFGDDVTPRHRNGEPVEKIYCTGPYASAADQYQI